MIAHAAPSSHVPLKRLYERLSPQDGAAGTGRSTLVAQVRKTDSAIDR